MFFIENHPMFGGEAKRNEFIVEGQRLIGPQGSNLWEAPLEGGAIAQLYHRIGFDRRSFRYQTWAGAEPEMPLSRCSYTKYEPCQRLLASTSARSSANGQGYGCETSGRTLTRPLFQFRSAQTYFDGIREPSP
jgi:hypothetical protein